MTGREPPGSRRSRPARPDAAGAQPTGPRRRGPDPGPTAGSADATIPDVGAPRIPAPRLPPPGSADATIPDVEAPRVPAPRLPPPGELPPRRDLAARQADLVDSLVLGAPAPPGFDADRLAAARRALLRKRAGATAAAWPRLAASLGADWPALFAASVADHPPTGALVEGWDLARALHRRGELGAAAAVELVEREVALYYDGRHPPRRRRGPALRRVGPLVLLQVAGRIFRLGRG